MYMWGNFGFVFQPSDFFEGKNPLFWTKVSKLKKNPIKINSNMRSAFEKCAST